MPTTLELAVGTFCLLLGIVWMLRPTAMMRLQHRLLYFYLREQDIQQTERQELIGRISGVVLAILGLVVVLGLAP